MSRRAVGFGCSGRCAPACGLPFGLLAASSDALRPCEGGVLELSGVFAGRPSLASSSATRARSVAFSASKPATRTTISFNRSIVSACARTSPISVSRSNDSSASRSIHGLTHIRRRDASPFTHPRVNRPHAVTSPLILKPQKQEDELHNKGVSNYRDLTDA